MWDSLLDRMLRRFVTIGRLSVTWPDGKTTEYRGARDRDCRDCHIEITSPRTVRGLCLHPVMALGDGYMDGTLRVATDRLQDFVTLLIRNRDRPGSLPRWVEIWKRVQTAVRHFALRNDLHAARRNVAHHYDLSDDLYRLFLDSDMQYSCAYFARPGMTLDAAQQAKKAHIAAKLCLSPGMRVLDIGCGWGGMALTLAQEHGVEVVGVTLSKNQLATARRRAREAGLDGRCDFRLQDYRELNETFDRVVSVGMVEHVGLPHLGEYFSKIADLMPEGGVALVHSIVKTGRPVANNAWVNKYIFPGSYAPAASELIAAVELSGLIQMDDECLRLHYADTLEAWHARFDANIGQLALGQDETFVRMWRFYLLSIAASFRCGEMLVQQLQLAKRLEAVPRTRDYLYCQTHGGLSQAAE